MSQHHANRETERRSGLTVLLHAQVKGGALLRVLLAAVIAALLLQGTLLLLPGAGGQRVSSVLGGTGGIAQAAALPQPDRVQGGEISLFGLVESRPETTTGNWVIGATAYTAHEDTKVVGEVVAGDCVEVKVTESTPSVVHQIVKVAQPACHDDGGDGDDDDNDDDDDRHDHERGKSRRNREGIISSLPLSQDGQPSLVGEWTILVGNSQVLSFTTTPKTKFRPSDPQAYLPGKWVEVKLKRNADGSLYADHVRIDEYEMGEIVVRLEDPAYASTIAAKYNLVLTSTLLSTGNIYLYVTASEDEQRVAREIAREKGVIWAEVNYVNSVPEEDGYKTWGWGGKSEPDEYRSQSAYDQIRLGPVTHAYKGKGVVVAVLDTGIYTPHEQFVGRLRLPSLDVIDDDSDPSEVGPGLAWGHGTHVAGIIAAVAPGAEILPVRVLDENGRGNTFLLAYAIEWATKQPGVKVINLSLGTEFDSKILRDAVEKAVAEGFIVISAAGNGGTNQVQYPAGYHDVIGVTAVDSTSHKAAFANYGYGWVDVAAPGVAIMSTMVNEDGGGYAAWSGTSMSTAFVSGAAALVAERWEIDAASDGSIIGRIVDTGLVLDTLNPLYAGQIGRLLDVSAALDIQRQLIYLPLAEK